MFQDVFIMWVCRNAMFTTLIFDGEHTHKNADDWGMVYGIAIPTLPVYGIPIIIPFLQIKKH